ncbi:MAG: PAAR domain-containing protein [Sandaracinaceae bacterium]|nr:PAAR domain-containing protein [Sandaracinaceae bacterium]
MSARPAARAGDLHACPQPDVPHVGGPVAGGSSDVFVNGAPAARAGDATSCAGGSASLDGGSSGVFINRQSAARVGDPAGHGGRVILGSPSVHIGDHGGGGAGQTSPGQQLQQRLGIVLHGDYDRTGRTDATTAEHSHRLVRPGAILLANLDIEIAVPNPPVSISTPEQRSRVQHLDAYQAVLRPGDEELSAARLTVSPYGTVPATIVDLVLHPADAARVRLFRANHRPPIAGALDAMTSPRDRPATENVFSIPSGYLPIDLSVEALALPGDPRVPGARGAAPRPPTDPFAATRPPGATGQRLYAQRAPGEVWIELHHRNGRELRRDVSLFTIAPFLWVANDRPAEMLYVVYTGADAHGSHPTVWDVCAACRRIFGASAVDMPASPGQAFQPHTPSTQIPPPSLSGKKVHLIGNTQDRDRWVQDQIGVGYCRAPQRTLQVVLHYKRIGGLGVRTREDFACDGLALYEGLFGSPSGGRDFGGNIVCTPPVPAATPAMPRDAGGPSIAAHPPAPLGKILFGDCSPRPAHRETHDFLLAQRVQPVLPIDPSWLDVGHVDEVVAIVPTAGSFKLLVASPKAMTVLLEHARRVPPPRRTAFHRGKYERDGTYAELELEDRLGSVAQAPEPDLLVWPPGTRPPRVSVATYNKHLWKHKIKPIAGRARQGLGLARADVLPVPMYFKVPPAHRAGDIQQRDRGHTTTSLTAACVNLQVLGSHLLVGRPFGPRLPPDDARRALADTFAELRLGSPAIVLGDAETIHWSPPGEHDGRIFGYYAQLDPSDRRTLVEILRTGTPGRFSPGGVAAFDQSRASLGAANPGVFPQGGSRDHHVNHWRRIRVPEDSVDLVESFLLTLLRPLGLTLHFVDAWSYHIGQGSVHCGTNVRRTPPDVRWWEHYDPTGAHWRYDPER